MGCAQSRDKTKARETFNVVDMKTALVEPPMTPTIATLPTLDMPTTYNMIEKNARGSTLGMLWSTNWGHLGDYDFVNAKGNAVIRALYDREDEKRVMTQGNKMYFEDAKGNKLCTLEKGMFSIKVLDVAGAPIGEITGAGLLGTISEGALDYKAFPSAEAKESVPKLLGTMLSLRGLSETRGLIRSDPLDVLFESAEGGGVAAKMTEVDEHATSRLRDTFDNEYTLEVAKGADPLAVAVLAVVYEKCMDEKAQERRKERRERKKD